MMDDYMTTWLQTNASAQQHHLFISIQIYLQYITSSSKWSFNQCPFTKRNENQKMLYFCRPFIVHSYFCKSPESFVIAI